MEKSYETECLKKIPQQNLGLTWEAVFRFPRFSKVPQTSSFQINSNDFFSLFSYFGTGLFVSVGTPNQKKSVICLVLAMIKSVDPGRRGNLRLQLCSLAQQKATSPSWIEHRGGEKHWVHTWIRARGAERAVTTPCPALVGFYERTATAPFAFALGEHACWRHVPSPRVWLLHPRCAKTYVMLFSESLNCCTLQLLLGRVKNLQV